MGNFRVYGAITLAIIYAELNFAVRFGSNHDRKRSVRAVLLNEAFVEHMLHLFLCMAMSERMTTENRASNWFCRAGYYMNWRCTPHERRGVRVQGKDVSVGAKSCSTRTHSCVNNHESIGLEKSSPGEACGTWSFERNLATSVICYAEANKASLGIAAKSMLAFLSDTLIFQTDITLEVLQL